MTTGRSKKRIVKKPVGVVTRDGRVYLEDGRRTRLSTLKPNQYALYSLRRLDDPDIEIHWRGSRKGGYQEGVYVRYLQETFKDSIHLPTNAETLEGLTLYRDWLYSWGVPIGSFNKAAGSLHFQTCGARPYPTLPDGDIPEQPFLSARIHYPNRYYIVDGWSWLWDIVGAYAWGAWNLVYPRDGWEYVKGQWSGHPLAWVHARWQINPRYRGAPGTLPEPRPMPDFAPFDLPPHHERMRKWYEANAFLLGAETHQIQEHLDIEHIHGSWEPKKLMLRLVTNAWREAVDEGRALPGVASTLAKRTANGLWGSLCAHGAYKIVNHRTGEYREAPEISPRSEALAGMIVSTVRMKLFAEGLTRMPAIVGHTDSVITPEGYGPPRDVRGDQLGQWRIKEKMYDLQAFGLTTRRYKLSSDKDAPWIYVNAGERGAAAERTFGSKLRRWIDPEAEDPPISDPQHPRHRFR